MACQRQHRGRRCLRLAALATAVGGGLLPAVPAAAAVTGPAVTVAASRSAAHPHPWIAITAMNHTIARPKGKVTVSGIVANPMAAPLTGLSVQLWSSRVPLATRQSMNGYLAGQPGAALDVPVPDAQLTLRPRVPAHATRSWSLTLDVAQAGMRAFGVYALAARLTSSAGTELDMARTFLPFWPGKSAARTVKPLNIGWVWPLIDTPRRGACPALLTNGLAASVAPGGRLATLLAAGQSPDGQDAMLTWAIDPALLSDVSVMKARYRVGARADCTHGKPEQASRFAGAWLSGVKAVTAQQDFFVTPYADVDLAALVHRGLDSELTAAFNDGHVTARKILGQTRRATPDTVGEMAWPAGGVADYAVLQRLAHQQVRAMILDSRLMPPSTSVSYTPTAATSTPDGLGALMHVLLADHGLSQILSLRRSQIPGVASGPAGMPASVRGQIREAAAFGKEQLFLAETAMIASEPAAGPRAVVAAPPRRWDPPEDLAAALLKETVDTPWLRPATLATLAATPPPPRSPARQQPPTRQVSPGELSGPLLHQVRDNLAVQLGLLDSILTTGGYLSTAMDAVESSAWRGGRHDQRPAAQLLRRELVFVQAQLRQVRIVGSPRVTLGGKQGDVPVSVRNNLPLPVTVRLRVTAPRLDHVVIGWPFTKTIKVQGKAQVTVKIPVQAAAAGSTELTLKLATPAGVALPGRAVTLTVTATNFGTLAIVIISVALVVFVLSAAARAIRRGGPQDGGAGAETGELDPMPSPRDPANEGGEPGSVGSGSVEGPQPAREDDEHATAPGRADSR